MYYSNRPLCESLNERLGVAPMSPMGAQYPASWADGDAAIVFSMSELDAHMARFISEIEAARKPAIITRDGRFVAVITPLAPGQVESRVLPVMARQVEQGWCGHAAGVAAHAQWSPALFAHP